MEGDRERDPALVRIQTAIQQDENMRCDLRGRE
jgi:hypothetical protein